MNTLHLLHIDMYIGIPEGPPSHQGRILHPRANKTLVHNEEKITWNGDYDIKIFHYFIMLFCTRDFHLFFFNFHSRQAYWYWQKRQMLRWFGGFVSESSTAGENGGRFHTQCENLEIAELLFTFIDWLPYLHLLPAFVAVVLLLLL